MSNKKNANKVSFKLFSFDQRQADHVIICLSVNVICIF